MWFRQLPWYRRIGTKITVLTGALVLVSIGAYTTFSIKNQGREVTQEMIRSVILLSDTIKLSTREDMLRYVPERLHQLVDNLGNQPAFEKVHIFNSLGEIIYSSDRAEMGLMVDKRAEQCYACHAAERPLESLSTPERTRIFAGHQGGRILGMINPIYNEPDCSSATCHVHPPDQKVLGVLDLDVSLDPMDSRIRSAEAKLLSIGLTTVVALSCLIMFLVNRFLNRPLKELMNGTHRVAQGDLETAITVRTEDELGLFAESFNQMTGDLKQAKQSLTDWGNRLEQMVEERTRDLERAQQQLVRSEKLASLGKLSAGIAHEINNPLTGILTFSQMLLDEFPADSEPHHDLEVIVRETIRCRNIVRGLLEFARQSAPEKQSVQINQLLRDILELVGKQELFQNIEITTSFDPDLPRLQVDGDQIKQVFFNIVVNAGEAMASGGHLKLSTHLDRTGSKALVEFADNGSGIPEQALNNLFDPFFTTKEMGTGLGLAISYGIIKAHHGNIEISSTLGQGTRVLVSLPVEAHEQAATVVP